MPRISAFYGIVIWMYHDEMPHRGRPHFHATYGDDEASIDIDTLAIIAGELPPGPAGSWPSGAEPISASCTRTANARANISRSSRSSRSDDLSTIADMRSTPRLVEAEPLYGHTVRVRFEDGTAADVDLSYLLEHGGVFESLREPEFFRRLRADSEAGTIVWPNEADIAPETLYARAQRRAAAPA